MTTPTTRHRRSPTVSPNNGPPGGTNTVTVTGTGFTGATAVDFGPSNPGTSIDVAGGGDSLTVIAPSGTGTVDVTVTTPNGTSAAHSPDDSYTYNAPPTVTAVSPTTGPRAGPTPSRYWHRVRLGLDHGRLRDQRGHHGRRDQLRPRSPSSSRRGPARSTVTVTTPSGTCGVNPWRCLHLQRAADGHLGQPEQRAPRPGPTPSR